MRYLIILFIAVLLTNCKHQPFVSDMTPTSSYIDITAKCQGCPTSPSCPISDDIIVNSNTTFTICSANPATQGTAMLDVDNCLIWTPNAQTDIVKTCIIVCSGSECDTTFFNILPPLPVGQPCSPDTVYFQQDILPILNASCAYQGCHNAASHKEGVVLDNYNNTLKEVKAGNPSSSELYEVITETKASKIMPPPPSIKLSDAQIQLIRKWILQGAQNLKCDDVMCDTINVSYNSFVKPSLAPCVTCHRTGNVGGGINLENYDGVKSATLSGRLVGSIKWAPAFKPMPQGGSKMPDCSIEKIGAWVNQGAKNN
jgi:hypothetical protein